MRPDGEELERLEAEIVRCRACPRLVAWREEAAADPPRRFRGERYWARPVPGFGDPAAAIVLVGLAPAANGANRTGRMFTGDRSGEWLYRALWRAGFADRPESVARDDGMRLDGAWITAPVRCAPPGNAPTPAERDACAPFLERELALLADARVYVALGAFGFDRVARALGTSRWPWFGHGVEVPLGGDRTLLGCYHVSQQNTFTGRLTEPMLDAVLARARELAGLEAASPPE